MKEDKELLIAKELKKDLDKYCTKANGMMEELLTGPAHPLMKVYILKKITDKNYKLFKSSTEWKQRKTLMKAIKTYLGKTKNVKGKFSIRIRPNR